MAFGLPTRMMLTPGAAVWKYLVSRVLKYHRSLAYLPSYCNSILQCLYYSVPFREHVLNYPKRSSPESLAAAAATAIPRSTVLKSPNGAAIKSTPNVSARNPGAPMAGSQKPDEKDSPEYKKKQALLNGPILNMSYQNTAGYDMPETLFTALKDVFEALVANQSRRGVISPTKFLEVLRRDNEMFRTAMHQDAHEFLNWLLNQAVESVDANTKKVEAERKEHEGTVVANGDISKAEPGSVTFFSELPTPKLEHTPQRWVHDLFEGTLTSETRCLTCENISQRDEAFLDLSVDLDQHSSVTACLRRFSEEEMLCERNKFHCDRCGGLQEAEKRMKIKRLPKILALHLKRFKYTEDLQRLQKLFHRVVYPYHLRLFNTTDDAEDPDRLYELYAVVVHIGGGPYHGHYVAIIKTQDRGWLLFDDEMVEPVDKSYVRNFFGDRPGLACAYVLFYQETTLEAVQQEQEREGKPRASLEEQTIVKVNGTADLHRAHSANHAAMSDETGKLTNLDHAVTLPQLPPLKSGVNSTTSPVSSPLSPRRADFLWRKDKGKEEKKLAEKERDKAEKHKRKELESKAKEVHTTDGADNSSASETPQIAVSNDHAPSETVSKENTPVSLGGLDRFKRTSKSLKFGSLGKKDKPAVADDELESPHTPDKEKKNRFSIRKKSFGILS
jgi:ubiquitin carboxyl-terminal hydrolase 9/13